MFKTLAKLYVGTGTLTGAFVYRKNMKNMQKTYPPRLSNETKIVVDNLIHTIIIGKTVYYSCLYPVVLTRFAENNMNDIIYPCYGARVTINDNEFLYTKDRNTTSFQPTTKIGDDLKTGINIEY